MISEEYLSLAVVILLVVFFLLLPTKYDPAIWFKEWLERKKK